MPDRMYGSVKSFNYEIRHGELSPHGGGKTLPFDYAPVRPHPATLPFEERVKL